MEIQNPYKDKRTSFGNKMYEFTSKYELILMNNIWLYFVLNLTWDIFMNIIGALVTLSLIAAKPKRYYVTIGTSINKQWGGLELGMFHLRDTTSTEYVSYHEMGHAFQNAIYGPFFPFLIGIPSMIRYWYQAIRTKKGKTNKPYDQMWFEGNATQCGLSYKNYIDKKKKAE